MQISLKAARVNKGLTQGQAAKALNVSQKTMWKWENGHSEPKYTQGKQLAELYGLSYDDINFLPSDTL